MLEFVLIYKWVLAAAIILGCALSLIGAHWISRNQSVQVLTLSQASSFGIVLGLLIDPHSNLLPIVMSFVSISLFYYICEKVIHHKYVSRSSYYVGSFAVLMSLTYGVTALAPALEAHMAASFFGDLATLSDTQAYLGLFIGSTALLFLIRKWSELTNESFEIALFLNPITYSVGIQKIFLLISLLTISIAVQFMGLLYTVSCLLIPSLIVSRLHRGLASYLLKIVLSSGFGVLLGFMASLTSSHFPTVPAVSIGLVLSSFLFGIMKFKSIHS